MNCQYKAEAGKPLAQINGNTDTANVAWEQNSNFSPFCWIWDASKIQIFCTSCTLEKKRANLFFSLLITSTSGAVRTQERGAAQLPGFILLSEPPSSIFCQRSQPEREQAQRNGVVASSQKHFQWCLFFALISLATAQVLLWRGCCPGEHFPGVFLSTDGQWRNQTSSAADKGNGFEVTLGMVDVWHHFLSSFPGFLKPKTVLLSGGRALLPLLSL